MKKVSAPKVVRALEASESPLPAQIQEALGELVGAARDGLPVFSFQSRARRSSSFWRVVRRSLQIPLQMVAPVGASQLWIGTSRAVRGIPTNWASPGVGTPEQAASQGGGNSSSLNHQIPQALEHGGMVPEAGTPGCDVQGKGHLVHGVVGIARRPAQGTFDGGPLDGQAARSVSPLTREVHRHGRPRRGNPGR
jgi:hypothetical protein